MKILVLNSGSSSLKYQVIDMKTEEMLVKGYFERIGQQNSFLTHKVNGEKHKFEKHVKDHEQALKFIFSRLMHDCYGIIKNLNELRRNWTSSSSRRRKIFTASFNYRRSY